MLDLVLNGGIQSFTLWAFVFAFFLIGAAWWRWWRSVPRLAIAPIPDPSTSWFVLLLLVAGTLCNLGYGLYRGYVAPRDILQDIVSAQECLAGRPLYPEHMNERMRLALAAEHPRISPLGWSESLHQRETETRERVFQEPWVQAHPPLMTLLFVPLVAAFGVLGTQIAFFLLSLVALGLTVWLLVRELDLPLRRRYLVLLALALFGADPIVDVLRLGQSGLILGLLLVLGWISLRRDRPWRAGLCIGLATALKLYPGLLLLYLLWRHPRAFLSALGTLLGSVLLIGFVTGWGTFADYLHTAHGVSHDYMAYPANLSLLGLTARLGSPSDGVLELPWLLFGLCAAGLLLGVLVVVRCGPENVGTRETLDLGYSVCVALMPVLSPIAWDHYLAILLLPLFVLGQHTLSHTARWGATLGFLSLLILLSIPETSFTWIDEHLHAPWSIFLDKLVLLPLRTYAVLALAFWLGSFAIQPQLAAVAVQRRVRAAGPLAAVLLLVTLIHVWTYVPSEPFYNNDETRHVMTGVFVRDLLVDLPVQQPRDYAVTYYLQYPALGLLVWPPFFYLVEGGFMLLAGTSFIASRVLVVLFALAACVSLYRLVARTHDRQTALLATTLLALAPLVFEFSHQVMLEVPTLACALFALERCQRYLTEQRRRDLLLCCLATACTALCRYDGIYLAPLYLIWLVGARQLGVLRRPTVWLAAIGAIALVAPAYLLSARELGGAHLQAVQEGTSAESTHFLAPSNFYFYPAQIPHQIGWFAVGPALLGFLISLRTPQRAACWPYFAMLGATYLTFTPMAEVDSRHAIYWVPALALFAARGTLQIVAWIIPYLGRGALVVPLLVVCGTLGTSLRQPIYYVRGYEAAAQYTVTHNTATPNCLMDGFLNGDFIYQTRRHDTERRLAILRGDKLLYGVLSDPKAGYEEWARDEAEMLALLSRYDPELIVIEEPQIYFELPGAARLRTTLRNHPERFVPVHTVALDSNHPSFEGKQLIIYRNTLRNPQREQTLRVRMLSLGGALETP